MFHWNHKQLCKKDSGHIIIDTKHTATAQRGPCKGLPNNKFNVNQAESELYIIPVQLRYEIFNQFLLIHINVSLGVFRSTAKAGLVALMASRLSVNSCKTGTSTYLLYD